MELVGLNFGPLVDDNQVKAFYGKRGDAFNASVDAADASDNLGATTLVDELFVGLACHVVRAHTHVRCVTSPGAGTNLIWGVVIGKQRNGHVSTSSRRSRSTRRSGRRNPANNEKT